MAYVAAAEEVVDSGTAAPVTRSGGRPPLLRIKWTDANTARLTAAVEPFEFIYDFAHPQHKDRNLRQTTWLGIAKNTGIVHDTRLIPALAKECERKFKNLRDELIKTNKRSRKTNKPYKHAEKLSFLEVDHLQESAHAYYADSSADDDPDYVDEDTVTQQLETAYATAQVATDGNNITMNEVLSYAATPARANRSAVKRATATPAGKHTYARQSVSKYEPIVEKKRNFSNVYTPGRSGEQETDELDDFSKMLTKRMRRLPNDSWGHVMSRLMDTLSSAEENLKKRAVKSAGSQTGD